MSSITKDNLERLKVILQEETTPKAFEHLAAVLLGELLGVSIAVAKSGFQYGGDAGPAGRQGRRFRIETKRYADTTSLSDRELLGEIDHAVGLDPAMEAWFLVATREAPEQLEQNLLVKSDLLGLPIIVIDWKVGMFPAFAALCTSSPKIVGEIVSAEAADLVSSLIQEGKSALASLTRDLESWSLGFERLRNQSHERLITIWNTPKTSMAALGQDAAGGYHSGTIRRHQSFATLSSWWSDQEKFDTPAIVIGFEGVGKTWAVLDWLIDQKSKLPIVLIVPSSAAAGIAKVSEVAIKQFLGELLFELTEARDVKHWQMRIERLLKRPVGEGPIITLVFDGMSQEPSVPWLDIIRTFQDTTFSARIRLILTTRNLHYTERLASLRGLVNRPDVIEVDVYDDAPDSELDQRLKAEGLGRVDLHSDLIQLARTPRLFNLVILLRGRLVDAGQVTLHRLLWEYGRDTLGVRAGKSFSEKEWQDWLQEVAEEHLKGTRDYNMKDLAETANRADLTNSEVFRRLSDIVDGRFMTPALTGRLEPTPHLVAHALGAALLSELKLLRSDLVQQRLIQWFDPINGLDQKPEILRAAVSILIEQSDVTSVVPLSNLVSEWLNSQNLSDEHRNEIACIAVPLCDPLLDVIEQSDVNAHKSARLWAVNSLRAIPRTNLVSYAKIINRVTNWLRVVSRDVEPSHRRSEDSEQARSKRFQTKIGCDEDGERVVLGHILEFVENRHDFSSSTIPSLLEGFPLEMALPVFEAVALSLSIRGRENYWEGLKWICLLNNVDFNATTAALRKRSGEIAALSPEGGIHPELSYRLAALLLWLSGEEDNEVAAMKLNPSLDDTFNYEQNYLNDPANSFFKLERRHAQDILTNPSIPIYRKIDRAGRFFTDPDFPIPIEFCLELRSYFSDFDVSTLDTSRYQTSENLNFEKNAPILARCAPDLLADLMRRKLSSFAVRPPEQRRATAIHANEQFLLANDESAQASRILRLSQCELNDNEEIHTCTQFLILEIKNLPALEQVIKIIEANLTRIFDIFENVLKPLSSDDTDALVHRYTCGSKKQISDLALLFYTSGTMLNVTALHWMATLAQDETFEYHGVVFNLLNTFDPINLGKILLKDGWSWRPDRDMWCNHYGSLALISATAGLPFEQYISLIAPWLIPRAIVNRGGVPSEAKIAAEVLSSILKAPAVEVPDLGSDIAVHTEERQIYPFALSISPRYDDDDPFASFKRSGDEKKHLELRQKAVEAAINRIKEAQSLGAKLYLHNVSAADLAPIVEYAPGEVVRWLEGADRITPDFKRRVRLAEGFYLALCEVLLNFSPEQGVILWRGLDESLVNSYRGRAKIDEMTNILFRTSQTPESLRDGLLSHERVNTDKALFELSIGASINGAKIWIDNIIANDLKSDIVWRRQRAGKLQGFTTGNVLPILGVWPDGPSLGLPASRQADTARWQHKEACARHWWDTYWQSVSDDEAYAAWVLFLEVVDRRAYVWMNIESQQIDLDSPAIKRRLAHFNFNKSKMKTAMKEQERSLDGEFLGRKIIDGVCLWGAVGD